MREIIIRAVCFMLLSSLYIAPALSVLTARRPFIVSQRRLVILGFAPSMAIMIYFFWPKYPGQSLLFPFLIIGFMTIAWGIILSRGYHVVGATRMVLNDALRYALHRLNLTYEESAQAYRLPTLNNELLLEATAIDWMFNLRFKRSGDRGTFRQ